MDAPTDETLLQEFLSGTKASYELLVRRYSSELFRFAFRLTGSSATAEDVVQDSFLQVFLSAAEFDSSRRFKPWLFTIAGNKARDFLRKRERRREVPVDSLIRDEEDSGRRYLDILTKIGVQPPDDFAVEEKRRLVREVMADMPVNLKEIIVLAYYHHFSYREIAAMIGVPIGTVKSRLHWAVAEFGQRYMSAAATRARDPGS